MEKFHYNKGTYEKKHYRDKFIRASDHTQKITFELYTKFELYYQILLTAKMSRIEISAKILKHKKTVFIIRITPTPNQHTFRVSYFF